MKKLILLVCSLFCSGLNAEGSLRNLIEYDKATCLEQLEKASKEQLWDAFLEGQAMLFFDSEIQWIAYQNWLSQAKTVLEIGSGNGVYLSKFAEKFQDKSFHGIELLPLSVSQSNERFSREGLTFDLGDAETFNDQLVDSSDIVLFRLTLQHLDHPLMALNHAWHYLSSDGHVIIIDSCDSARISSHPIEEVETTLRSVSELQKEKGKGNRKITLEILNLLECKQSPLAELYEVLFSNLDRDGHIQHESICLKGEHNRQLYFNHSLLFLKVLSLTYHIPVELSRAYDELKEYLEDENAWMVPGMHFLVLKRK